jgi:hypothetical protein
VSRETLRIPPTPGSNVIPDPSAIFGSLPPEAQELRWVLWGETWMTAKPNTDVDVLELEQRIESSPRGVPLDWPALSELLGELDQVIDGTFIGCRDPDAVPVFPDAGLDAVHRDQELVVTADDSSYWWVSGDAAFTRRVQKAFPHAERRPAFA